MEWIRKLRSFSGVKLTRSGEKRMMHVQTAHCLEEWQCNDCVKKQRPVESQKSPTADIVRRLRAQTPTATPYMQA